MLQRLANLKCFVQDLGSQESYLTECEWVEVNMMVEVLQIGYLTQQQFIFKNKISLQENACFIGEKSCLNWKSWTTIMLLLLPSRQEFLLRKGAFLAAVWVSSVCCDDLPIFFVDIILNSVLVSICALNFI